MRNSLHFARCLKRADPEHVKIVPFEIGKYCLSDSRLFSNLVDALEAAANPRVNPEQYQRDHELDLRRQVRWDLRRDERGQRRLLDGFHPLLVGEVVRDLG